MGQLLIVQGEEPETADRIFSKALDLFKSLARLEPNDCLAAGGAHVAKFAQLQAASSGIVRGIARAWACGAGTWFYKGLTGDPALHALSADTQGVTRPPDAVLSNVDGICALALGDEASGDCMVVTDRIGSLHVYRAQVDRCVVLCTSSMILAAMLRPAWDLVACREFLGTGTVFSGQRTLFEGIEKLEPASIFRLSRGRLASRSEYWSLAASMYDRAPREGTVPELADALRGATAVIARNFARPVFDLTGGFDSRALVGSMLASGTAFSTVVNGSSSDADVCVAGEIARAFQLPHRRQSPRVESADRWWRRAKESLALCDGEYDVLLYARVLDVHSQLTTDFDVTVNGSAGEMCRGYYWDKLMPFTGWKNHFDEHYLAGKRFASEGEVPGLMREPFGNTLADHFAGVIRQANRGLENYPNTAKMDNLTVTLWTQRWQGRIASATARLWPCVSPFMWKQPMELALSPRPSVRVRGRMQRRLLEHLNPRLARIPMAQGYPALPLRPGTAHLFWPLIPEFWERVSRRIPPIGAWSAQRRSPGGNAVKMLWSEPEVRELLDGPQMMSRELYNADRLSSFLLSSQSDNFSEVFRFGRILTLELLARAIRS